MDALYKNAAMGLGGLYDNVSRGLGNAKKSLVVLTTVASSLCKTLTSMLGWLGTSLGLSRRWLAAWAVRLAKHWAPPWEAV